MKLNKMLTFMLSFIVLSGSSLSFAQPPSVTNGRSYLQSAQTPDGYWGDAAEVSYQYCRRYHECFRYLENSWREAVPIPVPFNGLIARQLQTTTIWLVYTREETDQNIHDILKAIDGIAGIKSSDVKDIRLDLEQAA